MTKRRKKPKAAPRDRGMTARQLAFVNAFTDGPTLGNATQSARLAGYTGSDQTLWQTGSQLLRNPRVAADLARRAKAAEDASVMGALERRQTLTKLARQELDVTVGVFEGCAVSGPPKGETIAKAIEILAKIDGDFVQRHEVFVGKLSPEKAAVLAAAIEQAGRAR